jgi:hypothetical protein
MAEAQSNLTRILGKSFEIETRLSADEVREVIKERQRNRRGSGPKALVIGRLVLLWMPSFGAEAQPQLICRVTAMAQGSRIRGLIGVGMFIGWSVAAAFAGIGIVNLARGDINVLATLAFTLLPLLLFAFGAKSAEPLVRYLRNALDRQADVRSAPTSTTAFANDLTLEIGDTPQRPPHTPQTILDALMHLQEDGDATLFLSRRGAGSLQATPDGAAFMLERRIDGEAGYQRAFRRGSVTEGSDRLTREDALAAFLAYAAGTPLPETIDWRQVAPRPA